MDSVNLKFRLCSGPIDGLFSTENYMIFKRVGPGNIYFSLTQKGKAAFCHFVSDSQGLRHVKRAFNEFCLFVFSLFDWCTMVLAYVSDRPSIERVLMKCGFDLVGLSKSGTAYMRLRNGQHS